MSIMNINQGGAIYGNEISHKFYIIIFLVQVW